ncbi:aureobasidin resistance protein Aur1 [Cucurbitaria berberidis CBS 394.84]|uniref:Aureobasidin resistance protein Aur1 n=1 Tax=Cucurbitaria berberidis CBS 394.84 TaxID=1168544 RepID=A0A9P4GP65_9PLEO|nr:aureobasidin resistance protein Aur1 [Cucurbitaria berberidis CBS 394.84]KAF1848605.1 aureobasidin resistance protein Aur1 [Cucurbitaria berberidis CBS 394.84]
MAIAITLSMFNYCLYVAMGGLVLGRSYDDDAQMHIHKCSLPTAVTLSQPSHPPTSPAALGRVCRRFLKSLSPAPHASPEPPDHQSTTTTTTMASKSYLAFLDNHAATDMLARSKVPGLSALPSFIPHRVRRKWRATKSRIRSRQTPTSSIASLSMSFSPSDTLRSLRTHPWSIYDAQYLFLAIVAIFSLSVSEAPGPFAKTFIATLLMTGLCLPITRQFLLPLLPTLTWLLLFSGAKYISPDYRPAIWVRVLPALENILYGANLSNILSAHKHTVLDLLAWIPYGVVHYVSPVVVCGCMFIWGPPGTLPVFARAFGYMNIIAVLIQILFPCSPPWYENTYGLAAANYSIQGDAAGLKAIDKLFGFDMYTSTFLASPMVFGAFPSLHSGWATMETLFMGHVFPKLFPVYVFYTMWLWWSTMYFSHHYAVDLVAGSLLAGICFFFGRANFLPRPQSDKEFRWDYDYVEIGDPLDGAGYSMLDIYEEFQPHSDSDDWASGSSSSYSTGGRSPLGARSPTDDAQSLWDGDTVASDTELSSRKD